MQGGYYNMVYDDNSEYSGEYGGNDEYQLGETQQDFSAEPADQLMSLPTSFLR